MEKSTCILLASGTKAVYAYQYWVANTWRDGLGPVGGDSGSEPPYRESLVEGGGLVCSGNQVRLH